MLLDVEAVGLACLAVALAGPVSAALARARWPTREPRAALVLWQAVGLGGGLGILGAGFTLAAGSLDDRWLAGVAAVPENLPRLGISGWIGVALTLTVGVWLVVTAASSTMRVVLTRRAHRRRLDTVAETLDARDGGYRPEPAGRALGRFGAGRPAEQWLRGVDLVGVRLVDHPHAVAYCLPGLRPRVVVSRGTLHALDAGELAAVLAHERAHARGHHDLVVQPFLAWRETFPFLSTAWRAAAAVELLVEMLADDAARRTCRTEDLQRALQRLSAEHVPRSGRRDRGLDAQLAARTSRLVAAPRLFPAAARAVVYLVAVLLVVLPPAILLLS